MNASAEIGWYLTQGAWKNIGKITKKEDQNLKALGLAKKLSSTRSVLFVNDDKSSLISFKFSVTTSFNELINLVFNEFN